jgi:acetyl esterase/lipase
METEKMKLHLRNVPYGRDASQVLDIAANGNEVHAVVYIHGGAYFTGDKDEYPSFLMDYAEGNLFASVNYRVINPENYIHMGSILADLDGALRKICGLAAAHGVAIKDFMLVGHSAGGHIALLYGYKYFEADERVKIAACVSLAGPTDFTDDAGWSSMPTWGRNLKERLAFLSWMGSRLTKHPIELKQRNWTKQADYPEFEYYINDISPITYVSKDGKNPPTLLVHGRKDDQVPYSNAARLKSALDCASVPNKLITVGGSGDSHVLGGVCCADNEPITFDKQSWVEEAREWMEAYLR